MRACFCVIALLIATPVFAADKPEPTYRGKPLAYWVERLQQETLPGSQEYAGAGIIAFGEDAAPAIPVLVGLLEDYSPEYRELIAEILCRLGPTAKDAVPELTKRLREKKTRDPKQVIRILGEIGSGEKAARDAVAATLRDSKCYSVAVQALCKMGLVAKDAMPDFTRAVLEIVAVDEEAPKSEARLARRLQFSPQSPALPFGSALQDLHRLGADAVPVLLAMIDAPGTCGKEYAAMVFCELGSKGEKGVPALKTLLHHNQPEIRYVACIALWKVAKSPDVVPVLAELLKAKPDSSRNDSLDLPLEAVKMLGEIGPAAKDALPAIKAFAVKKEEPVPQYIPSFGNGPGLSITEQAAAKAIDKIEGKPKK